MFTVNDGVTVLLMNCTSCFVQLAFGNLAHRWRFQICLSQARHVYKM